jgi:hypothetical protein
LVAPLKKFPLTLTVILSYSNMTVGGYDIPN